jgi:hypothetical protein
MRNLYSLSDIIRIVISRKMRSIGHVVHMREKRSGYEVLIGNPKEGDYLEDVCWIYLAQ